MSPYRAALLALVVVGGALVAAVPTGATNGVAETADALGGTDAIESQADAPVDTDAPEDTEKRAEIGGGQATDDNESDDGSTLGADISSFMQSNVAQTDGAVETGMWSAAFNGTENRSVRERLVERRTGELRSELAELRDEKAELLAEREDGNISETAYKARMSRLAGQINALEASINATSSRAQQVGADPEELATLRTDAKNLSGPEVAAVARNVSGVGNGNGNGPPGDAGNGNAGDAGDGDGPGNGNADDAGNETTGRPDDPGNGASDQRGGTDADGENGASDESDASGENNGNDASGDDDRGQGEDRGQDDPPGQNGDAGENSTGQDDPGNPPTLTTAIDASNVQVLNTELDFFST